MRRSITLPVAGPLLCAALLTACGEERSTTADAPPPAAGTCDYPASEVEPARPVERPSSSPSEEGQVPVAIATSVGDLRAELDAEAAPCTVGSLLSLAEQGWYDDTTCHRLTTGGVFVLQCGDPTGTGRGGPGYTIPDELSGEETYPAGVLAMANTGAADSGGSQFFIVYEDTQLDPLYTVFGTLDEESLEIVRDVAADGVRGGGTDGPPATEVRITSLTTG